MDAQTMELLRTTPLFWNCECEQNYVHEKGTDTWCPWCGAPAEGQPDSTVHEAVDAFGPHFLMEE